MVRPNGIITLTTDFGHADGFVGAMKGVILSRFRKAIMVDIAHDLPRQDVLAGAMVLLRACCQFPRGTVHLAVVDPGVGSQRAGLIAETQDHLFILPDNGLLTLVAQEQNLIRVHRLENPAYQLAEVSHTFHGRDVFAPAAAFAASGMQLQAFGPIHTHPLWLDWPVWRRDGNRYLGEIMTHDIYGNAMSNFPNSILAEGTWRLSLGDLSILGPVGYYAAVGPGELLFLKGSLGFLEIAIREGSAQNELALVREQSLVLEKIHTKPKVFSSEY